MTNESKEIENPLDSVLPIINDAIREWHRNNPPKTIKAQVTKELDKNQKEILLKLLGFNNRWNSSYEVDHCNGRSGNSAAGDAIKNVLAIEIDKWLKQAEFPKLTKKEESDILISMRKTYVDRFKQKTRQYIEIKAENDAIDIISKVTQSFNVDKYGELMQLIAGEDSDK